MLAALSSQEIEHMLLNWKGGSLSKWKDRALKPELLDFAGWRMRTGICANSPSSIGGSEVIELRFG
jgi:hypothetical protein